MTHFEAMRQAYLKTVNGIGDGYVNLITVREVYIELVQKHGVPQVQSVTTSVTQLFKRS